MNWRPTVPLLLTALAACVAGYLAGRHSTTREELSGRQAKPTAAALPGKARGDQGVVSAAGLEQAKEKWAHALLGRLEDLLGRNGGTEDRVAEALGLWLADCPADCLGFLEDWPRRDVLLKKAAAAWAKRDPEGVSTFLATQRDIAGRDAMVTGMVSVVVREDAEGALVWIAGIKDPVQKYAAAHETGYWFYRNGEAAARAAWRRMGLPDSSFPSLLEGAVQEAHVAFTRRNAQNIASTFSAAKAAGANCRIQSVEEVVEVLSKGLSGQGSFSGSIFKVSTEGWTPKELADTMKHLEIHGNEVLYTTGTDL